MDKYGVMAGLLGGGIGTACIALACVARWLAGKLRARRARPRASALPSIGSAIALPRDDCE